MSAKPTAGPIHANEYGSIDDADGNWVPISGATLLSGDSAKANEAMANRDLFIEAINVHTETNLTPRQLVEALEYCYRSSGADTTHMPTRIGEAAKTAVDDLRRDYTDACEEVAQLAEQRAELVAAALVLKDVCNRPSAARTRAEAWRALDKALAAIAKATGDKA